MNAPEVVTLNMLAIYCEQGINSIEAEATGFIPSGSLTATVCSEKDLGGGYKLVLVSLPDASKYYLLFGGSKLVFIATMSKDGRQKIKDVLYSIRRHEFSKGDHSFLDKGSSEKKARLADGLDNLKL